MNHMLFWLIVGFAVGVFVGYKYPRQVEQAVETAKKLFNDVKDKVFKGSTPRGPQ
jgi:Na+/H+-dicarboxylate symporter